MSDSLQPHGLGPPRLVCPWNSPGKNTGVGYHSLFQGIFLAQRLNPHLLHWQVGSLPLSQQGSSIKKKKIERSENAHSNLKSHIRNSK